MLFVGLLALALQLSSVCLTKSQDFPICPLVQPESSDLDAWIKRQAEISWEQILKNVSPSGALPGMVVASLSTYKPDYFYSWTRDAAIVLKEIVLRYQHSRDTRLLSLIKQSISATQVVQSASFHTTASLGEPKYYVNGSPFTGPWGRPQRDGPALRATVYIKFALAYLSVGGQEAANYVQDVLYDGKWKSKSVIKADLEYISNTWNERSFDLWEEVEGFHFFTLSVIHRALKDGSRFAERMNDPGAASWYHQQAGLVEKKLEYFWDKKLGYVLTSRDYLDSHGKKSGLDVGTLLGCLHAGSEIPDLFRPQSKLMMDTFHAILNSMAKIYPINDKYDHLVAKAVGRYPEDIYDGVGTSVGNPWYITTLTMAEYLYRLEEEKQERLSIVDQSSETGGQGFDRVSPSSTMKTIADQFLIIVRNSIASNGSIHEQFHRTSGFGQGARDLTWSHVSFLSMIRARNHSAQF